MTPDTTARMVAMHGRYLTRYADLHRSMCAERNLNRRQQLADDAEECWGNAEALKAALVALGADVNYPPEGQLSLIGLGP